MVHNIDDIRIDRLGKWTYNAPSEHPAFAAMALVVTFDSPLERTSTSAAAIISALRLGRPVGFLGKSCWSGNKIIVSAHLLRKSNVQNLGRKTSHVRHSARGGALSFLLDWSPNHLLNPLWHPHARFHGALLLFFVAGVSLTGTWLLWRRSGEPELPFKVAIFIVISYWTPLFFVPFLLPSASWWAGRPGTAPRIDGIVFYPNLAVAALFLIVAIAVYRMAQAALRGNTRARIAVRQDSSAVKKSGDGPVRIGVQ